MTDTERLLQVEVYQLQKQLQAAYKRIKELNKELELEKNKNR
jgi:hypothetical protein